MTPTLAAIVETPEAAMPFAVVFSSGGRAFAQHPVNSRLSADELITALLPVLQGFEAPSGATSHGPAAKAAADEAGR